jgi:deazaflavin-dependent oxidoreductase (nitroreductase family)
MVPNRMRYVAKYVVNPLMSRSAGSARSPFALICHTGRRSGKAYETPIMVVPKDGDFVIALTYGPKVDWYRNLQAAGQGTLLWRGKSYQIGKPELQESAAVLPLFSSRDQFILRLLGIQHFTHVKSIVPSSART